MPVLHIFRMWKDTKVLGENLHRNGENLQTPHRQWPGLGIDLFLHQGYSKMKLNGTVLFKDLMYLQYLHNYTKTSLLINRTAIIT